MKLKLHHINLSSNNVKKMNDFYKNILLLDTETNDLPILERRKGYSGDVEFVTDGNIQTHLAEKDLEVNFKTGQSTCIPVPTIKCEPGHEFINDGITKKKECKR